MNNEDLSIVAIQDWQNYLNIASYPDRAKSPRPADAISEPYRNGYHPWGAGQNVLRGNAAFFAYLEANGIRYAKWKDKYEYP